MYDRLSTRTLYLGTFLLCLALLAFEILSVRTLSFVLGSGYIYFAIALAMLGLSASASLMSLKTFTPSREGQRATLLVACLVLAGTLIATYWSAADIKAEITEAYRAAGSAGGFDAVIVATIQESFGAAVRLGLSLSLPYFAFGFILTFLFTTTPREIYARLYFADLVGGALGCVLAFFAMEMLGFVSAMLMPVALAVTAGAVFAWGGGKRVALPGLAVAILFGGLAASPMVTASFEPPPGLNIMARDYGFKSEISERWRGWNSFSRVSAIFWPERPPRTPGVMALGNGEGHANLVAYGDGEIDDWFYPPAKLAASLGAPEDALVIFAGAGADMIALDAYANGKSRITGVELNHTLVDGAMSLSDLNLRAFFARPEMTLVKAEGRAFLQRDENLYDMILLSWSGATASYYAGSLGSTTQFVFTRESYEALLDHLKPGGFTVIMQVNKINALAALRSIMDERGLPSPERAAVVLYKPGQREAAWDLPWDDNPLLFKPDGFSDADLAMIRANLGLGTPGNRWQVAYAPDENNPDYWPYERVLTAPDLDIALDEIGAPIGLKFSIATDDRPFYLDIFPTGKYLDGAYWADVTGGTLARPHEFFRAARLMFVGLITVAALVLVLGPLFFYRGSGVKSFRGSHLAYFASLGAGFMFMEIGFMHKMSLLFGNPGLSIAIVLAALILFAGIGSYLSDRVFAARATPPFRALAVGVLAYALLYLLINDALIAAALGWHVVAKVALVLVLLAPGGLMMGQLFPQGLKLVRAENAHLVPWAWAINGAMGTIAAGLAPLIAQAAGFEALMALGAGLYGVILVLPAYRGTRFN